MSEKVSQQTNQYKIKTTVEVIDEVVATNSFEAKMKAKSVREHETPGADKIDAEVLREVEQ